MFTVSLFQPDRKMLKIESPACKRMQKIEIVMNCHHSKKQELNYLFVVVVRTHDFKNIIKISITFVEGAMSKWVLREKNANELNNSLN